MTATAPWQASPGVVEVRIDDAADADKALDEAVAAVKDSAIRHHAGILVTKTGPGQYTVRAHPAVPFGLTRQQYKQDPPFKAPPPAFCRCDGLLTERSRPHD